MKRYRLRQKKEEELKEEELERLKKKEKELERLKKLDVKTMTKEKLKFLTLEKLVDAVYFCGIDQTPVFLYIVGPEIGKTWSTQSIAQVVKSARGINYWSSVPAPKDLMAKVGEVSGAVDLYIFDNIERYNSHSLKMYLNIFEMIMENTIIYKRGTALYDGLVTASLILCSRHTLFSDSLKNRMLIINIHGLCEETREKHCKTAFESVQNHPLPRVPVKSFIRDVQSNPFDLSEYNLEPRQINNLKIIQKYLNDEDMTELIAVILKLDSYLL